MKIFVSACLAAVLGLGASSRDLSLKRSAIQSPKGAEIFPLAGQAAKASLSLVPQTKLLPVSPPKLITRTLIWTNHEPVDGFRLYRGGAELSMTNWLTTSAFKQLFTIWSNETNYFMATAYRGDLGGYFLESDPSRIARWPTRHLTLRFIALSNMTWASTVRGPWVQTNNVVEVTDPGGSGFFRGYGVRMETERW